MAEDTRKPTMIVAGNCQGSFLERAIAESPDITDRYRVVYFRAFRKGDPAVVSPDDIRDCEIMIEQIAHQAPIMPGIELLPADCKIIRYPILWMNSLWPFHIADPRNKPVQGAPAGLFPYGDRLMLQILDEGLTPEQASERYLGTDIRKVIDLDRFHEINTVKAASLDQRADLKWGGRTLQDFKTDRLFVSRNHPTMDFLHYMRDGVFDALGVKPPPSDLVQASGGMGEHHVPIHPQIAAHFGLEWCDPDMKYQHRSHSFSIGEYLRHYAAFKLP